MAKLYFSYSTMNAGKSTMLMQASYNYQERGMRTVILIAAIDDRAGFGALHIANDSLRRKEIMAQVDRDAIVPIRRAGFLERVTIIVCCIVHEHGDWTELLPDAGERLLH